MAMRTMPRLRAAIRRRKKGRRAINLPKRTACRLRQANTRAVADFRSMPPQLSICRATRVETRPRAGRIGKNAVTKLTGEGMHRFHSGNPRPDGPESNARIVKRTSRTPPRGAAGTKASSAVPRSGGGDQCSHAGASSRRGAKVFPRPAPGDGAGHAGDGRHSLMRRS